MRPQGNFYVDAARPQARAVCDRCGFIWPHAKLKWQVQWQGPRLQDIRRLVCPPCYDVPQEQLRTIVLPPDPMPILNARPEDYADATNPMSAIGGSANPAPAATLDSYIGTLWPPNNAFSGGPVKPSFMAAFRGISNSSYDNYVAINWSASPSGYTTPSSLEQPAVTTHILSSFTAYAPTDQSFLKGLATSYVVQGSPMVASWSAWTTLYSGTTTGSVGEMISGTPTGAAYQFHRIAFLGDGVTPVAVAQVYFSIQDVAAD